MKLFGFCLLVHFVAPASLLVGHARAVRSTSSNSALLAFRGGNQSPFGEINPDYVPPPRLAKRLASQDRRSQPPPPPPPPPNFYIETQTFSYDDLGRLERRHTASKDNPLLRYATGLHRLSPSLSWSAASCSIIFLLWQLPPFQSLMQHYFICSGQNLSAGRWPSIVLSAFSHAGIMHLVFNMAALLSLGPTLRHAFASTGWPLWPLLAGSAVSGSLAFLLLDKTHSGCMGLSGVTLGMLAVYAELYPKHILGTLVAGVLPVRIAASRLLHFLLVWSFLGTLVFTRSQVSHSAHLGGLLFGMAYYELWQRRNRMTYFRRGYLGTWQWNSLFQCKRQD